MVSVVCWLCWLCWLCFVLGTRKLLKKLKTRAFGLIFHFSTTTTTKQNTTTTNNKQQQTTQTPVPFFTFQKPPAQAGTPVSFLQLSPLFPPRSQQKDSKRQSVTQHIRFCFFFETKNQQPSQAHKAKHQHTHTHQQWPPFCLRARPATAV